MPLLKNRINRVALVGNHAPRQCGIATFTGDLAQAIQSCGVDVLVVAMNDREIGYDYPDIVTFQVDQHRLESYEDAAMHLHRQNIDVVCVQHEYGIFGGPAGDYLLKLLQAVKQPIITTLHTILQNPTAEERKVITELAQLSEYFVVMSQKGKVMLKEVHDIDGDRIKVICHGVPAMDRVSPKPYLEKLTLGGKRLILTFGLLSEDKGIQYMIGAMPQIVQDHPDAYYLIVGATHPNVRAHSGERYRQSLQELALANGVSDHVGFVDRFVPLSELTDYLSAASIYVTPYLKKEQITSGTLAYAFGSGKAVVSTPYWHAEELLADGKGILVPFSDSAALAREINGLLSNGERMESVQSNAFEEGKLMQWPVVGAKYVDTFFAAQQSSRETLSRLATETSAESDGIEIATEFGLDHVLTMTDKTGILQHSNFSVPNRFEGYCTDDNARLAIVGAWLESEPKHANLAVNFQHTGLSFMHHAFNDETERMRNFMSFDRNWLEEYGSEDSHGRSLWSLGVLCAESSVSGIREVAKRLFDKSIPQVESFTSPRAIAFTVIGLTRVITAFPHESYQAILKKLAKRLNDFYLACSEPNWRWFENQLAYDNARLSQALWSAGECLNNVEMQENAEQSLAWLTQIQTSHRGWFLPIGSNGFYDKGGSRAIHDQQPLEAAATIDACFEAFRITGDPVWQHEVWKAYRWFLGTNSEGTSLIDTDTGGCKDGLMKGGLNHNQGAESTLAFVASCLTVRRMELIVTRQSAHYLG